MGCSAAFVPDKFRIFQNFCKFFFNNPIDLYGREAPPGKTRPPLLKFPEKSMLFPGHERREKPACATRFTALVVRYSGECEPQRDSLAKSADRISPT